MCLVPFCVFLSRNLRFCLEALGGHILFEGSVFEPRCRSLFVLVYMGKLQIAAVFSLLKSSDVWQAMMVSPSFINFIAFCYYCLLVAGFIFWFAERNANPEQFSPHFLQVQKSFLVPYFSVCFVNHCAAESSSCLY